MGKRVSARDLAEVVTKVLVEDDHIEGYGAYREFMTRLAKLLTEYCGGEVRRAAYDLHGDWFVAIHGDNNLPDAAGGVWGAL